MPMPRALYPLFGLFTRAVLYPLAERRLGRSITPKLRQLRREAGLPFPERRKLARERLADVLEHAGRTVPYYRDLFAARGFNPAKVRRDERHLEDLPFLTKEILREQGKRLISEAFAGKIVREQKTGSSTGPAATVFYDREGLDWTAAQNTLMLAWGGKRFFDREAHLSTRFADELPLEAWRFENRKCFVLNRRNILTDGFGDAAQERLLADLRQAKARVVQGHPSSLYALARYLESHLENHRENPLENHPARYFAIFVSTGEMITEKQRTLIEKTLGVRVSNRYGACEFGVMAQERADGPRGELLVHDSLVWPEVLPDPTKDNSILNEEGLGPFVPIDSEDEHNEEIRGPSVPIGNEGGHNEGVRGKSFPPAGFGAEPQPINPQPVNPQPTTPQPINPQASGRAGELVFTGLRNPAMPLIRYRMGDLGVLEERADGWWLKELTGRAHDEVEIDGVVYPTHYIQDLLDRCGPVSDFQIVTREGRARELRLVADGGDGGWEGVAASVGALFPTVPVRRIEAEELVFTGTRGKFSYLLRETA